MRTGKDQGPVRVGAALAVLIVVIASFLVGENVGHGSTQSYVIAGTPVPDKLRQPLNDLWQGYQHLNADSYWRPFNQQQLLYDAVSGMVDGCCIGKDSHTQFFQPSINLPWTQALNGDYYGIGALVQMSTAGLVILAPYIGSPAAQSGLKAHDVITAVNGRDIRRLKSTDAVALIHGKQGTVVHLTVLKQGHGQPIVVAVTRNPIPEVLASENAGIAYLQFGNFGLDTAKGVHDALRTFLAHHDRGMVLDLRDNGGGYVPTAEKIASEFLPRGAVIYWARSHQRNGTYSDLSTVVSAPGIAQRIPIVVLVNGGTASAAEIVTAALRENNRARVLGVTTYGKGSVQEVVSLADGSSLHITIELWLTPRKHQINSVGITPDIIAQPSQNGQDLQLQRALQYLTHGR